MTSGENNSYFSRLYRVWSVMAFGPGTRMLAETTARFEGAEEMYTSLTCDDDAAKRFPADVIAAAKDMPLSSAEKIIKYCESKDIKLVTIDEELYPERLRTIYAPPSVLFYQGDISSMNERLSLGVVGTRMPSEYSRKVTSGIVKVLANQQFDIISGFAEGIDICAMLTAVKNGTRAYGVLGSGLDYDYPANNSKYRSTIISCGALISEYLPSTQPYRNNFLQRNRILTGLSMGLAVIEAGEKSGSLNSASHAIEQGRTVFAVPPCDLFDRRYYGNVRLIREGAVSLMGARDIYNEFSSVLSHTINENTSISDRVSELRIISERAEEADRRKTEEKKTSKSSNKQDPEPVKEIKAAAKQNTVTDALIDAAENETQKNILRCLNGKELRADELVEQLCENIEDILTALTELEIMGMIATENGVYHIA